MGIVIIALIWAALIFFTVRAFFENRKIDKDPTYQSPMFSKFSGLISKASNITRNVPSNSGSTHHPIPEFINGRGKRHNAKSAREDVSRPGSRVYKFSDLNIVTQAIYLKYNVLVFSDQLQDISGKVFPASPSTKIIHQDTSKPIWEEGTLAVVYDDNDNLEDVIIYIRSKELPVTSDYLNIHKKSLKENGFFNISQTTKDL